MFEVLGNLSSLILIIIGFIVLIFSGLAKWFGLLLIIVSVFLLFQNPIYLLGVGLGALMFFGSKIITPIIKLIGIGLMAWGVLTLLGFVPETLKWEDFLQVLP